MRREFLESIIELTANGKTVLLSSHQIGEVERVADTVAMVRNGRLCLVDDLDALKRGSRNVIVTLASDSSAYPPLPWPVIDRHTRGRQQQFLVSNWNEQELNQVEQMSGVAAVESHAPSLEEIFVAYMRQEQLRPSAEPGLEPASSEVAS